MQIVKTENKNSAVKKALAVLRKGGLLIYPTETCYGLGADAANPQAIKKILEFKGSRGAKPVSIAVSGRKMAEKYVVINETADNLYRNFLPGPLTIISKSKSRTAKILEAGRGTLGVRMPDHPLILKIIKNFGRPITSTSANASLRKTPYCLKDILSYTSKKRLELVDLFLDEGKLPYNPPSTVVDTTLNEPKILRQGEIKIKTTPQNTFISHSESETKAIAVKILNHLKNHLITQPLVFALQGELGSGKTQFVKGLGQALAIKENISSPTFVLIREYPYCFERRAGKLYHLDTWRLERGEELLELGLEEMLKPKNIVAIEWLQKMRLVLTNLAKNKKVRLVWVNIEYLSETKRRISYRD